MNDLSVEVSWLLCHLALYDVDLTLAARNVAKGAPAVVDNATAVCADLIGSLVAANSPSQLVDLVAANAAELAAALETISEDPPDAAVRVRLYSRSGRQLFDEWLDWRDLIEVRVTEHLPRHTEYLVRLAESVGAAGEGHRFPG
ncbi:hypothetical protein P3T37_004892 [Kitasatospora sp. MAA4]|uniref:hypothetical protein n=1 Tax=Kitasatospora sp. MAA4 TaxID=3035093 RepID=UPI0024766877|nr:hypothetical protein [Kitasatospora sp. MAA4]MDH6135477.1 hypothetical protein [Kitasatospora sp. MAA4]